MADPIKANDDPKGAELSIDELDAVTGGMGVTIQSLQSNVTSGGSGLTSSQIGKLVNTIISEVEAQNARKGGT